ANKKPEHILKIYRPTAEGCWRKLKMRQVSGLLLADSIHAEVICTLISLSFHGCDSWQN
ncbi:hypothetical protein SOVF_216200, partial [Spinacia oleracea]